MIVPIVIYGEGGIPTIVGEAEIEIAKLDVSREDISIGGVWALLNQEASRDVAADGS